MRLASNVEVLSVTPINGGKAVLLLLKDRNDDREYFYTMHSGSAPYLTDAVISDGLF